MEPLVQPLSALIGLAASISRRLIQVSGARRKALAVLLAAAGWPIYFSTSLHIQSSGILFNVSTFWEVYKGLIGVLSLCVAEALLIAWLLLERGRRRRANQRLFERLRFETLLAQLSADFSALQPAAVGAKIQEWLQRLVDFFGLDRAAFLRFSDDESALLRTHSYALPGIEQLPEVISGSDWPRYIDRLRSKKTVYSSRSSEEVPGSDGAKQDSQEEGFQSHLALPILYGSSVAHVLAFSKLSGQPAWADDIIPGLRLAGEIFSNAITRKGAEERLRQFFDLPLVGMAITSPDRRFLLVNQRLCDMLGYQPEELTGRTWNEVTHPNDVRENARLLELTLKGESEGYRMDKRYIHCNGEIVYASISARCVRREDGSVDHLVLIVEDITERKRAEDAVRESEREFRAVYDEAGIGIALVDFHGRPLESNRALQRILGYSANELRSTAFANLTYPEDLSLDLRFFRRLVEGHINHYRIEKRYIRRDGRLVWAMLTVSLVRDDGGRPKFAVAMIEDISERKRAEAELNSLNSELEQRIAARTAELATKTRELEIFAYSVAHDLKAPLRGIDGYSRLLLEDHFDKLDEEGRTFLNTIRASTHQMAQLIEDVLAYSQVERRELCAGTIVLEPFISALVEEKRTELKENGIAFALNVNGGSVIADASGLAQALRNYIDNAIKFTSSARQPRIEIGAKEEDDLCRIWVRDNGIGFDMKYHDRIFEIFQRLHPAEEYGGTGVGLAIVRKAIERMGGRSWAESKPGYGSTFFLEVQSATGSTSECRE